MKYLLYTDGASRGNPGPAAAGAVIYDEAGNTIAEISQSLGKTTNNVAEYQGLLAGLAKLVALGASEVIVRADSQLMVRQLLGEYRVKQPHLIPLYQEAKKLLAQIGRFKIEHVYREENKRADELANQALDS